MSITQGNIITVKLLGKPTSIHINHMLEGLESISVTCSRMIYCLLAQNYDIFHIFMVAFCKHFDRFLEFKEH